MYSVVVWGLYGALRCKEDVYLINLLKKVLLRRISGFERAALRARPRVFLPPLPGKQGAFGR